MMRAPIIAEHTTLSYCWRQKTSGPKQNMTIRTNLDTGKICIRVPELFQSLQDAIFVTRSVGIRYPWIDALCILQDDESDWATGSRNMAGIYMPAALAIITSRAHHNREDFLGDRVSRWDPLAPVVYSSFTQQRGRSTSTRCENSSSTVKNGI